MYPGRTGVLARDQIEAWLDGAGLSLADASRQINRDRNTLTRILNGTRECKIAEAIILSRLTGVGLSAIAFALGYAEAGETPLTPVVGVAGASGRIAPVTDGGSIDRPPNVGARARAVRIVDAPDVSAPFREQVMVYDEPSGSPGLSIDVIDRLCVVRVAETQHDVLGYLRRHTRPGAVRIMNLSGGVAAETNSVVWTAPILWARY